MVYNKHKLQCVINVKAITIHVLAYTLFLVSQMYLLITTLNKLGEVSSRKFGINMNIKTLFLTLSELCLCYAFWEIHKMSSGI